MSLLLHRYLKNSKLLSSQVSLIICRNKHNLEQSHKVNKLERRFLVWTGKYKTLEDVPGFVTQSTMERARNRMRIKIANYMMVATAIGCLAMVYVGKQAAKRGESVTKANLEWHRQINEAARKEQST